MLSIINNSSSYKLSQLHINEQDNLKIERKNLTNIFKLVIKDLIESTSFTVAQKADNFDKNQANLKDFFDVFENILNHGFKGTKKGFYSGFQKNDYSSILDIIEAKFDSANNNLKSIKDMTEVKTSLGKLRAWIKITIMQKQLAQNFDSFLQEKESLFEIYEKEALMLSEEANMISGLLIGLNGLDFSIDLKSMIDTLDFPIQPINYSTYLREKIPELDEESESKKIEDEENNKKFYEILNQKNYLEEINKTLKSQLDAANKNLNELTISNEALKNELLEYKVENLELKTKFEALEEEFKSKELEFEKKYDSIYMDQMTERETFVNQKNGLDQMYIELQKQIVEESKQKLSVENELKTQKMMKSELESALKLMDHSLVEKQNTINKLREQLDQVKAFNLELNSKFQEFDSSKQSLTDELNMCQKELKKLIEEKEETKLRIQKNDDALKEKCEKLEKQSNELLYFQKKKDEMEVDLSIEKNWRQELQAELNTQITLAQKSSEEILTLNDHKEENKRLHMEMNELKLTNSELERTLEEMGSKLGVSVEKMEDFKEATKQISEYQWEQDDQVTFCKLCNNEFNVARRKHHCRRCGRIFCHDCSDNKMSLPSFSKPVRVCDTCCESMIQNSITSK